MTDLSQHIKIGRGLLACALYVFLGSIFVFFIYTMGQHQPPNYFTMTISAALFPGGLMALSILSNSSSERLGFVVAIVADIALYSAVIWVISELIRVKLGHKKR